MIRRALMVVGTALVCLLLSGCGPTMVQEAVNATEEAKAYAGDVHSALKEAQQAEYDACLEQPTKEEALACGDEAKKKYAKAWAGYRALREVWISMRTLLEAARLKGADPIALAHALDQLIRSQLALVEAVQTLGGK